MYRPVLEKQQALRKCRNFATFTQSPPLKRVLTSRKILAACLGRDGSY